MKKIALLSLMLAALAILPTRADDTQPLIDKVIATYGGEQAWRDVKAMAQEGSTYSAQRHFSGKTRRLYQHPGQMVIDIQYKPGDTELRQLDGNKAWNHGEPAPAALTQAAQLQAWRLVLPKLLIERRGEIKSLGQREDESGQPHEGLVLDLGQGMQIIMDVNIDSGRIMASWGMMEMAGQRMEFASIYDDFRTVEGRLLSFKETHYAQSEYIGYTLIEKTTFPEAIPAATFRPQE